MAGLSGIWESLNDKCWPLVDAVKLNGVFEKYNIPPIVLPLALVAILLLVFFMLSPSAPAATGFCGDDICQANETYATCQDDCPAPEPTGARVTVELDKNPDCKVTVKLLSSQDNEVLGNQEGQKRQFRFDGIDADSVYVTVKGISGEGQETNSVSVTGDEQTISVTLEQDLCTVPVATTGRLRLTVKDSSTNTEINGVSVSIAETQNGQPLAYSVQNQQINGHFDVRLSVGKTYTIYASKEGFSSGEENIYIDSSDISKVVSITPLPPSAPETGEVEVCVKSGGQPAGGGLITLMDSAGNMLVEGDLEEAEVTEPTLEGCYAFSNLLSGSIVSASMQRPPAGCVPAAATPPSVTVEAGRRTIIDLEMDCQSGLAYLKLRVLGRDGLILTENATVTLWTASGELVPGTGAANSLALGSAGYTEEVSVPSGTSMYAWARGLPLGYLDYKSPAIVLNTSEHKAVDLNLSYREPEVPSENFTFTGVTVPSSVVIESNFTAMVEKIFYGDTELPSSSNVTASIGGSECSVVYSLMWVIECQAPGETNFYDLIFRAHYEGSVGDYSVPVEVVYPTAPGEGMLTITPVSGSYGEPPLVLQFDIKFNGVPVTQLAGENESLVYLDSRNAYPGEIGNFAYDSKTGHWKIVADVPYKGDYRAMLSIQVLSNGTLYSTSYTFGFTSTAHSEDLEANVMIFKKLLTVSESYKVEIVLTFKGRIAYGLSIFKLYNDNVFYTLLWKNATQNYALQLAAPSTESCSSQLRFVIKDVEVADPETIIAIDLSKPKSGVCPLDSQGSCSNVESARKCYSNYVSRTAFYSTEQITACVVSACPSSLLPTCPSSNKGDLNSDCAVTSDDVGSFEEYMQLVTSASTRNGLAACLDMDNDGDVDNDDVTCLQNMAATRWYGDIASRTDNNGACIDSLRGGFCFDIDTGSPIPGDLVYDRSILEDDTEVMQGIIDAVSAGVTTSEDLLYSADFNKDGTINQADLECQRQFMSVDFETGTVLSASIDEACMAIFGLGCGALKGDINAGGNIDEIDLLVVTLMAKGYLAVIDSIFECADVNSDGRIDNYDVECIEAYLSGDTGKWLACLDCDADLPEEAYSEFEICNDGYDNNCDGMTDDDDPLCECSNTTPCGYTYDSDGGATLGIEDGNYKRCISVDWTSEAGTTASEWTLEGGWSGMRWISAEKLAEGCADDTGWGHKYTCSDKTFTCVYNYPSGFKYDNRASPENFVWMEGLGNIGPVGTTEDCDSYPLCADDWVKVQDVTHDRGCCEHSWGRCVGEDACRVCRFKYDFCKDIQCGSSGSQITNGRCSKAFNNYRESCTKTGECMGVYGCASGSTCYTYTHYSDANCQTPHLTYPLKGCLAADGQPFVTTGLCTTGCCNMTMPGQTGSYQTIPATDCTS